jgi:ribonuclease R
MKKKTQSKHEDPFFDRESEKYEKPVPSREYILKELETLAPIKRKSLARHFKLETEEQLEAFRRRLNAMLRDCQIVRLSSGFVPATSSEEFEGTLYLERDGEGYVRTDSGCIKVERYGLRGMYEGDVVKARIMHQPKGEDPVGRVVELIKPIVPITVGRFMKVADLFEVLSFDRKFNLPITIPKSLKGGAKADQLVEVKILREEKYSFHPNAVGEVIEILGDFSTPGIEVDVSIKRFDLPTEWPKTILSHVGKIPKSVSDKAKSSRLDLTNLSFVTIDGDDAKDFDDAIYVEALPKGGWKLLVAIADVGHYVKSNSALDKEAQNRGNSTYFPGKVIPMLPEELSNGICSLNPNVERLVQVCQMSINANGEIKRSSFHHAVIRSHARLTYREVGRIYEDDSALKEKYAEFLPMLNNAHALYEVLKSCKQKRGALELDSIESKVLFDKQGKIKEIVQESRNVAHKIIEECMLAANICAAKFIQRNKRAVLFRIHETPPEEKIKTLRTFLAELGLKLPGKAKPTVADFTELLNMVDERPDKHIIQTVVLRSMSQAQYSPKNIGHFGLAYPSYTHFTSPIRRYPDLIVHRVITEILEEKPPIQEHTLPALETLGEHCCYTERRSDEASRDALMSLKCHYMQDKVGDEFEGVVAAVTHFGLFVELKNVFIEGLIHVTSLGQEYFQYDAVSHQMRGEGSGTTFGLGDLLHVRVVRVDLDARRIDLELAQKMNQKKSNKSKHEVKHAKKTKKEKSGANSRKKKSKNKGKRKDKSKDKSK